MAAKWPKIIRDPVHNVISFEDAPGDRLLLHLINCREFQRLRRIKQLGLSELVFPGANHTRFAHSIGVLRTAKKFLHRCKLLGLDLNQEQETFILCAALLHDVGHGPFSHAFETVTKDRHERRTLEIIQNPDTEVHQKLTAFNPNFPAQLGMFFDEDWEEDGAEAFIPSAYTEIVSSQMDADRFDYLLRDSICTGTQYGRFDLEWILEHLDFHKTGKRHFFYVTSKAFLTAEAYVFARYHMYRTVYFHKTTRAAEVMLKLLFQRLKAMVSKFDAKDVVPEMAKVAPGVPEVVVRSFSAKLELQEYLELDDFTLNEFFKACSRSSDPHLAELGGGLLHRRLFKGVDMTTTLTKAPDFKVRVLDFLRSKDANPEFVFGDDTPADTPYKPYDPDAEKPAAQIYVDDGSGKPVEISTLSEPVSALRKKYQLVRYYFPERYRDEVRRIVAEL